MDCCDGIRDFLLVSDLYVTTRDVCIIALPQFIVIMTGKIFATIQLTWVGDVGPKAKYDCASNYDQTARNR